MLKMIFWTFTLLVILAPLPFGMVYELTQAAFACLILLLAGILCLYQMINASPPAVPLNRVAWETAAFTAVVGWALMQMLPVTPAVLHHPLWAEAGRALGQDIAGAVSLSPGAGFQALVRLVCYAGVFWLAMQLGRDRQRARLFLDVFILAGTFYATYAILMRIEGIREILWVEQLSASGETARTVVNRNNFATHMGLVLLCAVGAYLSKFQHMTRQGRQGRDRIIAFLHTALVQGALRIGSILILMTALFLTGSRGGIVSSLAALTMLLLFFRSMQTGHRRVFGLVAGALIAALLVTALMSGNLFFRRLDATDPDKEYRLKCYEQVWHAIQDAPWIGFGLGSFKQAFPLYADIKTSQWAHAHNDWLEMIFELGWPGALFFFGVLTSLVFRCLAGFFRRQRDHLYPLVGFCAGLLVGLHAFMSFSLHVPAVTVSFAALLGIGVAQSFSSMARGCCGKVPQKGPIPLDRLKGLPGPGPQCEMRAPFS